MRFILMLPFFLGFASCANAFDIQNIKNTPICKLDIYCPGHTSNSDDTTRKNEISNKPSKADCSPDGYIKNNFKLCKKWYSSALASIRASNNRSFSVHNEFSQKTIDGIQVNAKSVVQGALEEVLLKHFNSAEVGEAISNAKGNNQEIRAKMLPAIAAYINLNTSHERRMVFINKEFSDE